MRRYENFISLHHYHVNLVFPSFFRNNGNFDGITSRITHGEQYDPVIDVSHKLKKTLVSDAP